MKNLLLSAVLLVLAGSVWCLADTIILNDGSSVTGTVLAEKDSELIVDIGIEVLKIPREKIAEHKTDEARLRRDANDVAVEPEVSRVSAEGLYRTAELKKTTIEKCVEAFSEAVVMVSSPGGMGSGFFINEQGYLITNHHVIEKETRIEVTVFQKGEDGLVKKKFKKVKIEAINPFVDLALLKVQDLGETKVQHVLLGDIGRIKVGERVFAIGNPLGLERSVSQGIISTKNRAFEGLVYLQTTAAINPGNSGGPLFNLAGEVIGVTNMGYIFLGGLGFAIPIDYVRDFIDNRDAFVYDEDNPNTGYKYIQPQRRRNKNKPEFAK